MTLYSMVAMWRRMAEERPDAPAVTVGDGPSMTWSELHRRTNQVARVYAERGVGWGDIVTLALPTSIGAACAIVATIKLGATPNPISAKLAENELRELLDLAQPALVVAE